MPLSTCVQSRNPQRGEGRELTSQSVHTHTHTVCQHMCLRRKNTEMETFLTQEHQIICRTCNSDIDINNEDLCEVDVQSGAFAGGALV